MNEENENENENEILEAEKSQNQLLEKKEGPKSATKKVLGEKIEGKFHGIEEHYNEEGKLVAHLPFEAGVLHGEARRYDSSQRLKENLRYNKGTAHGLAEFYKNGTLAMHTTFNEGKQQGEYEE
mgnify:CR=1 FL=1